MKGIITEVKLEFTDNNGIIKLINFLLQIVGRGLAFISGYLYVIPAFTLLIADNINSSVSLKTIYGGIIGISNIAVAVYIISHLIQIMIKSSSTLDLRSTVIVVMDVMYFFLALDIIPVAYKSGMSIQAYQKIVVSVLCVGAFFTFLFSRITIKNIGELDCRESQFQSISSSGGVDIEVVLGTKVTKINMLQKFIKGITFYEYSNGSNDVLMDIDSYYDYLHSKYESILGTKDIMKATGNVKKIRNVSNVIVYIPDDYKKTKKYYYGVIRYLMNEGLFLRNIEFAGNNTEKEKANEVLEIIKQNQMATYLEREILNYR